MPGVEAGQYTPFVMGFRRSQYAQLPAGQVEPWWPDTPQLSRMNWLWLNSNGCGKTSDYEVVVAPPHLVTGTIYYYLGQEIVESMPATACNSYRK
jgi:hypothetical protein